MVKIKTIGIKIFGRKKHPGNMSRKSSGSECISTDTGLNLTEDAWTVLLWLRMKSCNHVYSNTVRGVIIIV